MNAGFERRDHVRPAGEKTASGFAAPWPAIAAYLISLGALAIGWLTGGTPLALGVGGIGLVTGLGVTLFFWRRAPVPALVQPLDTGVCRALLLALDNPAALINVEGLVEANAAWIGVVGRRGPEAFGLPPTVPAADLPLSLKAGGGRPTEWRVDARLLGAGDLVFWTLTPVEDWRPLARALGEVGLGWIEVDANQNISAAGALPAPVAAIGRPLDEIFMPLGGSRVRRQLSFAPGPPHRVDLVLGPANQAGGRLGIVIDVTEKASRKADLEEAETRFRRFFDDAPVGIAVVGAGGRIVDANLAFAQLVGGVSAEAIVGQLFGDFVHGDEVPDLGDILSSPDEAAFGAPIEIRFKGDREERAARLYTSRQGQGEDAQGILFLLDTTRQKTLELQIAQSQKLQAVGQLAGGIAHDFNNLLTAIIGFSDLLLIRHSAGDQSFADIMQIKQNANRAANLVRQLLAFSRQQTLRPKVLDVTDVLAELANLLRRLIGENIELRMVHGRDLGPVQVDPGQLDQVIINLAVNARDAMAGGGVLSIRTANVTPADARAIGPAVLPEGDYVLIEVTDTGHGISSENLGKIFEPFFTTKEVGAGTGLGLSTVYGIVKQTGGFIVPTSAPGRGATFSIYLPRHLPTDVAEPPVVESAVREAGRDLTGKGTILLVEDEDAVRTFAGRALRNKGYTVLEAASGERALEIVMSHNGRIDLLISDVVMPSMDGPTLIKQARRHRYDMKIIFISGYAEEAFRRNLDPRETFAFLPKPFSLKQLASKVKEAIGGA